MWSFRISPFSLSRCPTSSCATFHHPNPTVRSFYRSRSPSYPSSSFHDFRRSLPSPASHGALPLDHPFPCPDVPPPPVPPSTTPTPRLDHFIAHALHRTRLHPSVTFAALYLLQRLKARFPAAKGSSGRRLFISAFMLASKIISDGTYSNKSSPLPVPTSRLLRHLPPPQPHGWITLLLTPSVVPISTLSRLSIFSSVSWHAPLGCYVTVGTFTRRGLSSTAKTLRSLKGGSSL